MGNQMVTNEIKNNPMHILSKFLQLDFDKIQVKKFLNFMSMPFDYLLTRFIASRSLKSNIAMTIINLKFHV